MHLTRRRFCLLAASAIPVVATPVSAQGQREPRSYYGGFRLGIQSACYGKLPLAQAIAKVTGLGLKYVELSTAHADLTELSTSEVRRIRARLLDSGLSTHDYGVVEPREKQDRRKLETIFRRAEEFGLETLLMDPAAPLLKQIERLARRYRVNAGIVNRPGGYQTAEAIWDAIGDRSERLGAAVDTGRLVMVGQAPVAAIEKLKGRILAIHLSDVTAAGRFCVLGQGRVDFAAILKTLQSQQYDNLLTLACDGLPEDRDSAISASLDYLKKLTGGK